MAVTSLQVSLHHITNFPPALIVKGGKGSCIHEFTPTRNTVKTYFFRKMYRFVIIYAMSQTFKLHSTLNTFGKTTSRTFFPIEKADLTLPMSMTNKCFLVLHSPLKKAFAALTRENPIMIT